MKSFVLYTAAVAGINAALTAGKVFVVVSTATGAVLLIKTLLLNAVLATLAVYFALAAYVTIDVIRSRREDARAARAKDVTPKHRKIMA